MHVLHKMRQAQSWERKPRLSSFSVSGGSLERQIGLPMQRHNFCSGHTTAPSVGRAASPWTAQGFSCRWTIPCPSKSAVVLCSSLLGERAQMYTNPRAASLKHVSLALSLSEWSL